MHAAWTTAQAVAAAHVEQAAQAWHSILRPCVEASMRRQRIVPHIMLMSNVSSDKQGDSQFPLLRVRVLDAF